MPVQFDITRQQETKNSIKKNQTVLEYHSMQYFRQSGVGLLFIAQR